MSDWFSQAVSDIGNAFDDAATAVAGAVEDVANAVADVVDDVATAVGNVVDDVAGAVGEVVDDVAAAVGQAAEDVAEFTLNALDDYVFDPVDYITGGAIDIDYDNGQFSAGLDLGIASVGISVGDQGFSAEAGFDIGIASGDASYSDANGFSASGSIGIDYGPLPYAEGHMEVSPEGDISIGGHLQGSLPIPGGSIGGEIDGGLYRNADGSWGASTSLDVNIDGPLGTGAEFSTDTSLGGDGAGNVSFDTGLDVSATGPGGTGAHFGTDTSLDVGSGGIGFDTGLDVTVTGPGGSGAHLGADSSIDLGRDGLGLDTGLDVSATGPGGTGAHFGTDTSLDVGSGGVGFDTGLDVTVTGPGGSGAHLGADTSIDLGRDGLGLDTGLDVSVAGPGGTGAHFGTDTSLDVGSGGVAFDNGLDVSVTGPGGAHAGFSTDSDFGAGIDADGNLTVSAGADVNVDVNGRDLNVSGTISQTNLDLPVLSDVDVSVTMPDALDAPAPDPTAEAMSALAGSGNLADVLSGDSGGDAASALFGAPLDAGQAIDAASAMVDSGAFDTFTSDVVSTDIVEAEADSVWDDVGP